MNVDDLSQYPGLSKSKIYKLTHLKFIPMGNNKHIRQKFFDKDEIDVWLMGDLNISDTFLEEEFDRQLFRNKKSGHFLNRKSEKEACFLSPCRSENQAPFDLFTNLIKHLLGVYLERIFNQLYADSHSMLKMLLLPKVAKEKREKYETSIHSWIQLNH